MKRIFKVMTCFIAMLSMCLLVGCNEFNSSVLSSDEYDVDIYNLDQDTMFEKMAITYEHSKDLMGKTIRVQGQYGAEYTTLQNEPIVYHFAVVFDEDACSYSYFEFKWPNHKLVEFPNDGDTILVTGIIDSYMEAGAEEPYYYIRVESLEVLEEYEEADEAELIRQQIIEKEK